MAEGTEPGVVVSRPGVDSDGHQACAYGLPAKDGFTVLKERKREGEYASGCVWPGMLPVQSGSFHHKGAEPCFRGSVSQQPLGALRGAQSRGTRGPSFRLASLTLSTEGPAAIVHGDCTTSCSPWWC